MVIPASSPARMRRLMPWILWSSGGLSVLGAAFVVLWIWLPRWAPEWVVRYSPWVDPVLRAMAVMVPIHADPFSSESTYVVFGQRITMWGSPAGAEFIAGLGSADPKFRQVCVWALHHSSPHPQLVRDKLIALALADENEAVRAQAYYALRTENSPRMSEVRARAMKDGNSSVRHEAVGALDSRTSDLDWQTLLSALNDPDKEIRYRAVLRVEEMDEIRAASRLIEIAPREEGRVFLAILSALSHLKVVEAIPVLTGLIESVQSNNFNSHFHYASELLKAISAIDAAEGFRVRKKILQGSDVGMRAFASQELGESADQHAIEPLTNLLQDSEPLVFGHVVIALCRLKAVSAVESILDLLEVRRADLIDLEIRQGNGNPTIGGRLVKIHFSEVIDQVATLPLSSTQRERLDRLRKE